MSKSPGMAVRLIARLALAGSAAAVTPGIFGSSSEYDSLGLSYLLLVGLVLYPLATLLDPPSRRRPTPVAVRRKTLDQRLAEDAATLAQRRGHRRDESYLPLVHPPLVTAAHRGPDQQLAFADRLNGAVRQPLASAAPALDRGGYVLQGGYGCEVVVPSGAPGVSAPRLSHGVVASCRVPAPPAWSRR